MKTKALLLTLALVGSCFAEDPKGQPNPLIAKIDARLAELKTNCDQDSATINRLTDSRRIQLQKNSQAYQQCLEASLRIKEAKSEEKTLQTYRASLGNASPSANRESPAARLAREIADARATPAGKVELEAGKAELEKRSLQDKERRALEPYKRQVIAETNAMIAKDKLAAKDGPILSNVLNYKKRAFDVAVTKEKATPKKNLTPAFKGFYLGMPGADALGLMNSYMKLSQPEPEPITIDSEIQSLLALKVLEELRDALDNKKVANLDNPYRIVRIGDNAVGICQIYNLKHPFAILDERLNVTEFHVTKAVRDKFFDAENMPLDEFIKMFSEAYKIDLPLSAAFPDITEGWVSYTHRDARGFELTIWAEKDKQLTDEAKQDDRAGGFYLKQIGSEKERKSKFD